MGILTCGTPLPWTMLQAKADEIRHQGVLQFVSLYKAHRDRVDVQFTWGDEVEYLIVRFDERKQKVRVSLEAKRLLATLTRTSQAAGIWQPEFGAYMLESTPTRPYVGLEDLECVERSMKSRRQEVARLLDKDEAIVTMSCFPTLGTFDFTSPQAFANTAEGQGRSLFFPDEAIHQQHPRFASLADNIRQRRGSNVFIQVPVFRDRQTPRPFIEDWSQSMNIDGQSIRSSQMKQEATRRMENLPVKDHIYMDAMGFGMGCCCLQVTLQAANLDEARHLFDQLTPLAPLLLAMTAASPVYRGYLSDIDTRWLVIAQSVDDRTPTEMNTIRKSRYDSVDMYIHPRNAVYNDQQISYDESILKMLTDSDVDRLLAQHVAHLFKRDPIVFYREKLVVDIKAEFDHFESIQTTNWQTVRLKPPPACPSAIGWRVEFRPMEIQLDDFENAAFVILIVLLSRLMVANRLNLVIPISKVETNMTRAHKRDALRQQNFWFRQDSEHIVPMSLDTIFNGSPQFQGLLPMLHTYLYDINLQPHKRDQLNRYLHFIAQRASGQNITPAQRIRNFIRASPYYRHDSKVDDKICYDLLRELCHRC